MFGLKQTPIFEWCMVGCELKIRHQKQDTRRARVERRLIYMLKFCQPI